MIELAKNLIAKYITYHSDKWFAPGGTASWGSIIGSILFWLVAGTGLFVMISFLHEAFTTECGYPKRNEKYIKKKLKSYTWPERFFLVSHTMEADRFSPMLVLDLLCQWLNILAYCASLVGAVGMVITRGAGWAEVLLSAMWDACILIFAIEFIPTIIFVPSERRRYFKK